MKQHITIDQIKEISDEEFNKLATFIEKPLKVYKNETIEETYAKNLNIGKMIEIVGNHLYWQIVLEGQMEQYFLVDNYLKDNAYIKVREPIYTNDDLCNILWNTIKILLPHVVDTQTCEE